MKFDELDFEILDVLIKRCDQSDFTSTDIAKELFEPEDRDELIKKNTTVSYRLNKLVESNIVCVKNGRIKRYSINDELTVQGESFLQVNGEQIEMGNALVLKIPNGMYLVQYISYCR